MTDSQRTSEKEKTVGVSAHEKPVRYYFYEACEKCGKDRECRGGICDSCRENLEQDNE